MITFESQRHGTALVGTYHRAGLDNCARPDLSALLGGAGDEATNHIQRELRGAVFVGEAVCFLAGIGQLRVAEAREDRGGFEGLEKSTHALFVGLGVGDNRVAPCVFRVQRQ